MNQKVDLKTERNSSVELLRIIAMAFVVLAHSSIHGRFPETESAVPFNYYLLDWLCLGNLGVDIFVIISGYYLCTRDFRIRSLFKLLVQVWFFSYFSLVIYLACGYSISGQELIRAVFPVIFGEYWFFTAYFVLLLLTPHINLFLAHAARVQLRTCLYSMLVLWCLIPTLTTKDMAGTPLLQFVMLYLLGAYLRLYPQNIFSHPRFRRAVEAISTLLLFASSVVLSLLGEQVPMVSGHETTFYSRTSVLVVGLAVGIVASAVYRKPWTNRYVNRVASCAFGVYLLHDNPLLRKPLWSVWFRNNAFYNSEILIFRILVSAASIYLGGIVVEFLRQKTVERPMIALLEKGYAALKCLTNRICEKSADE